MNRPELDFTANNPPLPDKTQHEQLFRQNVEFLDKKGFSPIDIANSMFKQESVQIGRYSNHVPIEGNYKSPRWYQTYNKVCDVLGIEPPPVAKRRTAY